MRLFVAVDMPESVQERLGMIACGLPGARWVPPEQLHLTLHFIGEVDGAMMRTIQEALGRITSPALQLCLQGVGVFPLRGKSPHTLWVGVEKSEALLALHRQIASALLSVGCELEQRKYAPHLTLARLKNAPAKRLNEFIGLHMPLLLPAVPVKRFRLYSSILGPKGAKHYVEQEYLLDDEQQ
ncbi:MAG: RNA 2',3'-cyclic phosphodiesterase [Candidatus Electrothrix aestuarii]|uniref:RNA 2',3'-cyclic phosphodiesterase n=1 Tax=Candidatus Electrothrix aestuarii TaxID=3062594 RepID=A0AAU8LPM2_9BACT|nr:RNA 2',3'-cyclic phosphodiesterase [Candidatus Electrothrix aestuarii]